MDPRKSRSVDLRACQQITTPSGRLLTMKEFVDPIPKPGSSGVASGQFRLRVPKTIHARLTSRAEQEGVSLNTLVTAIIAEGLGKRKAS